MTDDPEDDLHIRFATTDDMREMMALAMSATDENALLPPASHKIAVEMWAALSMDHGFVACIGKPGGIIEGAILMRIGTMWYSEEIILEEKALYIHEDYRSAKGGRATRLAEYAKKAADELMLPLMIGVLSSERTAGKIRMYKREFGDPAGAFFLYRAKTGQRHLEAAE